VFAIAKAGVPAHHRHASLATGTSAILIGMAIRNFVQIKMPIEE